MNRLMTIATSAILFVTSASQAEPMTLSVINARAMSDAQSEMPYLVVRLSGESVETFAEFSTANVGRQLDVVFEGQSLWRPYVSEPIVNGYLQIFPGLEFKEARKLADRISIAGEIEVDFLQLRQPVSE